MRRPGTGRDVTRLLADFGHDLPASTVEPARAKEARLFARASRRGPAARDIGWMIEELRVSLFAQVLGTAHSVSAKRIRAAMTAATP